MGVKTHFSNKDSDWIETEIPLIQQFKINITKYTLICMICLSYHNFLCVTLH
jgi:hypothetical protein